MRYTGDGKSKLNMCARITVRNTAECLLYHRQNNAQNSQALFQTSILASFAAATNAVLASSTLPFPSMALRHAFRAADRFFPFCLGHSLKRTWAASVTELMLRSSLDLSSSIVTARKSRSFIFTERKGRTLVPKEKSVQPLLNTSIYATLRSDRLLMDTADIHDSHCSRFAYDSGNPIRFFPFRNIGGMHELASLDSHFVRAQMEYLAIWEGSSAKVFGIRYRVQDENQPLPLDTRTCVN